MSEKSVKRAEGGKGGSVLSSSLIRGGGTTAGTEEAKKRIEVRHNCNESSGRSTTGICHLEPTRLERGERLSTNPGAVRVDGPGGAHSLDSSSPSPPDIEAPEQQQQQRQVHDELSATTASSIPTAEVTEATVVDPHDQEELTLFRNMPVVEATRPPPENPSFCGQGEYVVSSIRVVPLDFLLLHAGGAGNQSEPFTNFCDTPS